MTANVNVVSSLKAGSGIDIQKLADDLVEAERAPRKDAIDKRIAKSDARISALGVVNYNLLQIKTAFQSFDEVGELSSVVGSFDEPSALTVTTTTSARAASYSLRVVGLAHAQVSSSAGLGGAGSTLGDGSGFSVFITKADGVAHEVGVTTATPQGVVDAINAVELGIEASLVNTGVGDNPYQIVLVGGLGADNAFTVSLADGVTVEGLDFSGPPIVDAVDAELELNGLTVRRPSNVINDLVDGVTLTLKSTSATSNLKLEVDPSTIETKLDDLVTKYNDLIDALKVLDDRGSAVEQYGGSLAGDSLVFAVTRTLRGFIEGTSSGASGSIAAGRDIGLEFDRYGKLTFDKGSLDSALAEHFPDVVKMLTNDKTQQSVLTAGEKGLAGDAARSLDLLTKTGGLLDELTKSATTQKVAHQSDLDRLDERMTRLHAKYIEQFSLMDSIVSSTNSSKTGMQGSFDAMMASLKNG